MTETAGSGTSIDSEKFRSALRAYFDNPRRLQGENVSILATGEAEDGAEIVIAKLEPTGTLLGVHVHLSEFASQFDPNDAVALANVVADEIAEPAGTAEHLDVPWAVGLVERPEQVGWRLL